MSEYRLYSIDRDGKIRSAERIDANNDHEALFLARAHGGSLAFEVWADNRLVGRVADYSGGEQAKVEAPARGPSSLWP